MSFTARCAASERSPTAGQRRGARSPTARPPPSALADGLPGGFCAPRGAAVSGCEGWAGAGPRASRRWHLSVGLGPGRAQHLLSSPACPLVPLLGAEKWWPARSTRPSWRWSTPLPCTSGCAPTAASPHSHQRCSLGHGAAMPACSSSLHCWVHARWTIHIRSCTQHAAAAAVGQRWRGSLAANRSGGVRKCAAPPRVGISDYNCVADSLKYAFHACRSWMCSPACLAV